MTYLAFLHPSSLYTYAGEEFICSLCFVVRHLGGADNFTIALDQAVIALF
jgi:hypothetical protein